MAYVSSGMAASSATDSNADPGVVVVTEGDLGKECHALGVLFQQIVNELKVRFRAKQGQVNYLITRKCTKNFCRPRHGQVSYTYNRKRLIWGSDLRPPK